MGYLLQYHPEVKKNDLPKIPRNIQSRIRKAIEQRLVEDPAAYSFPLRKSLKGYRKLRVGDYRVVFKIEESVVIVLMISHRKEVYQKVLKR